MNRSILKVNKFFCIISQKYRRYLMKNIFTLLTLLSVTLFAQVDFSPYKTDILSLEKDTVSIKGSANIALGATGVIIHSFDESHQTIIANVEVIKREGDTLRLKVSSFNAIPQEALPTYNIAPKIGDSVILNFLYNRAMAIVPDEETYKLVTKSYKTFTWIHPDIFATKLAKSYNPTPTREIFQEECIAQNVGLLLFAIKGKGHFVDCHSFKTINTIPLPEASSVKLPFYSRLAAIKGRIFGLFGGKGVINYDSFYSKLLEDK